MIGTMPVKTQAQLILEDLAGQIEAKNKIIDMIEERADAWKAEATEYWPSRLKEAQALLAEKDAEIAELCRLLMRGSNQLENWHKWYGNLGTPSLPPHGDVRFLEDSGDALVKYGRGL